MGLLDKLWDDTLAGPRPESGLGKLRKYDSIPATRSAQICDDPDVVPITRSITILTSKSNNAPHFDDSGQSSPASSGDLGSPSSPVTPREDLKRLMRRKSMPEAYQRAEPRNPTVYDWVVISALDR